MTSLAGPGVHPQVGPFRHEALFYAGQQSFLDGTVPFIRGGVIAGEPVLVVVDAGKIALLREALGGDADGVHFADMADVGTNPGAIISAWHEFVDAYGGTDRPLRGIGEPIWPGRSATELVECHRHEALLNLAFADTPSFWLLCPYDTEGLTAEVVAEAQRTHPHLAEGAVRWDSPRYQGLAEVAAPFAAPLPAPPAGFHEVPFDSTGLESVRTAIVDHAAAAGLPPERGDELVLAVHEAATNSVRHGGGAGTLRVWGDAEADALVCEIADTGRLENPLAGRRRPAEDDRGGWGMWLANELCDLVQLRSSRAGTTVRLHVRR